MITLVTGGARSGKSTWALNEALAAPPPRYFIATATPFDAEMSTRIARHRDERGNQFTTVEEPLDLATALSACDTAPAILLLDCLTVWLGNVFHNAKDSADRVLPVVEEFVKCLDTVRNNCIIVTNEVGMGIVPDNRLSRDFRDMQGYLNRRVAQRADRVVFMVSGIPIIAKSPDLS